MDYIIEIDQTAPAKRLVTAKVSGQALQYVARGIISIRPATASDIYDAAKLGIEREDANAAEAAQATLRGIAMRTSESIAKIAPALHAAQIDIQGAAKSATNPHFKSRYTDLATLIDSVKPALNDAGIMFIQSPGGDATGVTVTTRFLHVSGEWIEDTIYLPVPQQTPQAYGSAITYAKRYALQSMTGTPSEDDDGEKASEAPATPAVRKVTTTEFAKHKAAINDAPTLPELQRAFTAAYILAETSGDQDAVSRFTDLKNAKKDELKEPHGNPAA